MYTDFWEERERERERERKREKEIDARIMDRLPPTRSPAGD